MDYHLKDGPVLAQAPVGKCKGVGIGEVKKISKMAECGKEYSHGWACHFPVWPPQLVTFLSDPPPLRVFSTDLG